MDDVSDVLSNDKDGWMVDAAKAACTSLEICSPEAY